MRKSIRRIVCMTAAILVLFSLVPAPARAVDPVSAATMANALAQAITAYGASQGVSMMYDVTDTNGIGEGVHDLWDQFKTDINDNDVPTYDSLAVTTWSTIYKKVGNSVAINLSDTVVSYLDRFWNWLLSGPAEMTKVDNQYYEWTLDQAGNVAPIVVGDYQTYYIDGNRVTYIRNSLSWANTAGNVWTITVPYPSFAYLKDYGTGVQITLLSTIEGGTATIEFPYDDRFNHSEKYDEQVAPGWYQAWPLISFDYGGVVETIMPTYSNFIRPSGSVNTSVTSTGDTVSVQPYVGAETPENVYFPDNDDVNYQPLPYVGPLDIPWQNAWGDGETVTDAIGTSIAGALDDAIVDDGTLQLEGDNTVNPPIDDVIGGPDDYQVPGLADVFPFCIPFDIYNFLSALAADPVAPHFSAEMEFPEAIGGTQTIDIDFDSPTWNQLAQLLRLLELLAFIVGLALLTRSMFIRG